MLSNKRSRIFVSFLTLMAFLSVLVIGLQSVGVQAEGPSTGDALSEAAQHELDTQEAAQQSAGSLRKWKTVSPSTNIQHGSVMTYNVRVENPNATSVTNITINDPIPHFARFNKITNPQAASPTTNADATFDSSTYAVKSTNAFTLGSPSFNSGANGAYEFAFEVDTTAICGHAIENDLQITQGGKTVTVERDVIAWDNIYTGTNVDDEGFFNGGTGSWQRGVPSGEPYIGAASGDDVWATNLSGQYSNSPSAGSNFTHTLTATINFTDITVIDGSPLYITWMEYFNANVGFDNGIVRLNGTEIHNTNIYDPDGPSTSADTEVYKRVMINLLDKFTVAQLANKSLTLEFLFVVNDDNSDFGWYIDDVQLTSCNKIAIEVNKLASTSTFNASTCTTDATGVGTTSKTGNLSVISGTTVNYCYAIKNTGNISITNIDIDDAINATIYTETKSITDTSLAGGNVLTPGETFWAGSSHVITQLVQNEATFIADSVHLTGTYQYITESTTTKFNDISSSGTQQEINDPNDVFTIQLPITFTLFGEVHNQYRPIAIGLNGAILFTNTASTTSISPGLGATNTPLPLTGTTVAPGILPLWDDYDETGNAQVFTHTTGTAPNRIFTVQWNDVPHDDNGTSTDGATFQVIMEEATGLIQFVYKDVSFGNATYDNGASATIGLNKNREEAIQYSYNGGQSISDNFSIKFRPGNAVDTDSIAVGLQELLEVELEKTVATTEANACISGTDHITVSTGTSVYYCYTITNTSEVTVELNDLVDDPVGQLFETMAGVVGPNSTYTYTHGPVTILETTVNTGTWTAHAANYQAAQQSTFAESGKWVNIGHPDNTGTAVTFNGEGHDDEGMIDIGFDFFYFGQKFTQTVVGRNGGLIFNTNATDGDIFPDNQSLPNSDHPLAIFPFWDDFESNSGSVRYQLMGTAPDRKLIVQWDRLVHFGNSSNGTFQAILYETSSRIDFNYSDVEFGPPTTIQTNDDFDFGRSATIGLSKDGTKGLQWSTGDGQTGTAVSAFSTTASGLWTLTYPVTNNLTLRWDPLVGTASDMATVTVDFNASILFTKTVGTTADTCAPTSSQEITVASGTTVYYCFWVENTGDITLTSHTLVDAMLGIDNTYNNYSLAPGAVVDITQISAAGIQSKVITTDTVNTATWTANASSRVPFANTATQTDTATVNVGLPPTAVEMTGVTATNAGGQLPLGSLVVGMLLLVAGGYVLHRRRNQLA